MADAVYKIKFTMSDGSVKEIQFTAPQGPQGPAGTSNPVYARSLLGHPNYETLENFINTISTNPPPVGSTLLLTFYGATTALSISCSDTSNSTSINPGDSVMLTYGPTANVKNWTAMPFIKGVINVSDGTELRGDISFTGDNGLLSYIVINSTFDLSPYLG